MAAPLLQPPELSPEQAHTFHERAAILEFDGKLPREMAEALALAEVKGKRNEKSLPHLQKQLELFTVGSQSMTGKLTLAPALSYAPAPPAQRHSRPRAPAGGGRMHSGNLASSKRLQDTLAVLRDGQWHSTREIRLVTNSEAVHSDLAALRANGVDYECKPAGEKKYAYRLKLG